MNGNEKEAMSFLHDSNASRDPKMIRLRCQFGWAGIGIYWAVVEKMRESNNFKLQFSDIDVLAVELFEDKVLITTLVNFCCDEKVGLFLKDELCFWAESLLRRMEKFISGKLRMSQGGKRGMETRFKSNKNKHLNKHLNKVGIRYDKVKEKKLTIKESFIKPTIKEIKTYILENKYDVNPERWLAHYESNGWLVGKNPMKDWKAAVRTWTHGNFDNGGSKKSLTAWGGIAKNIDQPEPIIDKKQNLINKIRVYEIAEKDCGLDEPSKKTLAEWKKDLAELKAR